MLRAPVPLFVRKNAIFVGSRCLTRCCDAQCAVAVVFRINAIFTSRRGGRVNREGRAIGVSRINAIFSSARRRTRCCDAQGARAVVLRINAISAARRGGRVNREEVP